MLSGTIVTEHQDIFGLVIKLTRPYANVDWKKLVLILAKSAIVIH
jgi:hypothetical protein